MLSIKKFLSAVLSIAAMSVAQASPVVYNEATDGDIVAAGSTAGTWVTFTLDAGNNVFSGTSTVSDTVADFDSFRFILPTSTILTAVRFQYGSYSYVGPLIGFGMTHLLWPAFYTTSPVAQSPIYFTEDYNNALTTIGPRDLFGDISLGAGTYDWGHGLLRMGFAPIDFSLTSATFDYQLTFEVQAVDIPEPNTIFIIFAGFLMLMVVRKKTN